MLEERDNLTEMWGLECLVSLMLDKPQTYFFLSHKAFDLPYQLSALLSQTLEM